jgi:hypothetical protein
MTEPLPAPPTDDIAALRERADTLERKLREAMETAQAQLVRVELKAEAIRAGMIDLDGLKLIEPATLPLNAAGEIEGAGDVIQKLKRAKPWLFGHASSSSAAPPPPSTPPRAKLATEMTLDEWRAARTEMLKRRG